MYFDKTSRLLIIWKSGFIVNRKVSDEPTKKKYNLRFDSVYAEKSIPYKQFLNLTPLIVLI